MTKATVIMADKDSHFMFSSLNTCSDQHGMICWQGPYHFISIKEHWYTPQRQIKLIPQLRMQIHLSRLALGIYPPIYKRTLVKLDRRHRQVIQKEYCYSFFIIFRLFTSLHMTTCLLFLCKRLSFSVPVICINGVHLICVTSPLLKPSPGKCKAEQIVV